MEYLQYVKNPDVKYVGVIVLNLIINGIPSIHDIENGMSAKNIQVLNLIINGIPSILKYKTTFAQSLFKF